MTHDPPSSPGPAGIYLHFPFCARRRSYRDFPTVIGNAARVEPCLRTLEQEIRRFQPVTSEGRYAPTNFFQNGSRREAKRRGEA